MDTAKFIRDRLRQARQDKGLSQTQVAQLLGIAQATLSDMETGRIQISALDLYRIAAILAKPITYFYPAQLDAASGLEAELLNRFTALPEDRQKQAIYAIDKQVLLRERILPYERAGIPEEHYGFLVFEEEQMLNAEEAASDIPSEEHSRATQKKYEAFLGWREEIDARLKAEHSQSS